MLYMDSAYRTEAAVDSDGGDGGYVEVVDRGGRGRIAGAFSKFADIVSNALVNGDDSLAVIYRS